MSPEPTTAPGASPDDPLLLRVRQLCDTVEHIGGPGLAEAVAEARAELAEPALRLAVVGRVKAGKSTLVNAIVGRRVAPTDEGECTRVVTQYRWGAPERGEAHLTDGRVEPFALVDGGLPETLPWPAEEISHTVVHLQQAVLKELTLIDTPGLGTTTSVHEEATRRALLEARLADALVYVFRDVQRADDVTLLREYAALTGRPGGGPHGADSIGVLTHADTFGAGAWGEHDPLVVAQEHAGQIADSRRSELGTVVPVSGLMAQAVSTGMVTEPLTRELAALAGTDELELRFPEGDLAGRVDRLVAVVGELTLRHGRSVATTGSRELQAWMLERSNRSGLEAALRARYVGRHRQLKARAAVDRLLRAANAAGQPWSGWVHEAVSDATTDAALHALEELRAWEEVHAVHPGHPAEQALDELLSPRGDAARLGLPSSAASGVVAAEARRRAVDARERSTLATDRVLAEAYLALSRSYGLIARRHADVG